MIATMNRRVAVRGIIVVDGKLLCLQLKPYNRETREYFWCTPGGGMDMGESIENALTRELIEELGIKPVIGNLAFIQQFKEKDTGNEQLELFFNILNPEDYLHIDLTNTSHGEEEIEEFRFIDPREEHVLPTLLQTEPLEDLENKPVKIFSYF